MKGRECKLKSASGSDLYLLISATSHPDIRGRVISYEGIAKDITARVQMERQLQRADKLASLGQISPGIAHEINNPLVIMLGYTELLLRDQQQGTQTFDDLKIIEKHALNCKTIVEDRLKFARGTSTKKDGVDLADPINEVISLVGHQFELDNIPIETIFEPHLPRILGDHEKLTQVFMNLLVNAKQAIKENGRIVIRVERSRSEPGEGSTFTVFLPLVEVEESSEAAAQNRCNRSP